MEDGILYNGRKLAFHESEVSSRKNSSKGNHSILEEFGIVYNARDIDSDAKEVVEGKFSGNKYSSIVSSLKPPRFVHLYLSMHGISECTYGRCYSMLMHSSVFKW